MNIRTQPAAAMLSACLLLASGCTTPPVVPEMRDADGDVLISADVRSALRADGAFADDEILVETFHGTVLLQGLVDFEWQRTQAFDLAANIDGVNHVQNDVIYVDGVCPALSGPNAGGQP